MAFHRSRAALGAALLLGLVPGAPAPRVLAQGSGALASRTVHGKVEMINESVNAVAVISDKGERMAWQFDKAVIAQLADFKVGDPVVVIYRQRGTDKAVTAIGFPGAAATPLYINTTGHRVELVSGPMVDGACGKPADAPPHTTTIPIGGRAETSDACWCCAPAGEMCTPANKTGLGRAFLTRCYP
jgi:hypothetical protein